MGFFSRIGRLVGGGSGDDLRGWAQVVAASGYRGDGYLQACSMNLVIQVEGIPAYSVEHSQLCSRKKWPVPGMTIPVRVDATNPQRFRLDFDAVPDEDEQARRLAEQQAAVLRGEAPSPAAGLGFGLAGANVQFVGGSPADLPPEKLARLEQFLGTDLDGDGIIGAAASQTPAASAASASATPAEPAGSEPAADAPEASSDPAERIEHLERLTRLRDAGALSPAEFESEKRRLLES